MEEKLKNKKLKIDGKNICELLIDLALDDRERKKYNKSFAKKKAVVNKILDTLDTNEIHLENIKGWEGYIQRTITTRDDFDVKTFKKENPELHEKYLIKDKPVVTLHTQHIKEVN